MKPDISAQKGFTLIELMIAMAIAGIVMAAMFAYQQTQTRGYVTQEALTGMQQNARAGMYFMISEIRMAGCDPDGNAGAGIEEADDGIIRFTMDFTDTNSIDSTSFGSGDITDKFGTPDGATVNLGEHISYQLSGTDLVRTDHADPNNPVSAVIAQNIDALDFVYRDRNRDLIDTTGGPLGSNDRQDIRSVHITIVSRSGQAVPGFMYPYVDDNVYQNPVGEDLMSPNPPNDNFRRLLLSNEIRMRNM